MANVQFHFNFVFTRVVILYHVLLSWYYINCYMKTSDQCPIKISENISKLNLIKSLNTIF